MLHILERITQFLPTMSTQENLTRADVKAVSARLFMAAGVTIPQWARKRGYSVSSVYSALSGRTRGPKSRRILAKLKEVQAI